MHVASCRVAMDAAGQLHRVFQAPGSDPSAATAALADQVEAWRDRLATRATIPGSAAGPL
jgi:predicted trehalose synthase